MKELEALEKVCEVLREKSERPAEELIALGEVLMKIGIVLSELSTRIDAMKTILVEAGDEAQEREPEVSL